GFLNGFLEVVESGENVNGLLILVPWFVIKVVSQDRLELSEGGSFQASPYIKDLIGIILKSLRVESVIGLKLREKSLKSPHRSIERSWVLGFDDLSYVLSFHSAISRGGPNVRRGRS